MLKLIAKRLGTGVVLLFVISTLTFLLLVWGSGNIGRNILGVNASQEQVAAKNIELGLDQSISRQYADWLNGAVRGDFGRSWFGGESVTTALTNRLRVTLTIVTGAVLIGAIASVILGVTAAVRGGGTDRAVQAVGLVGFAIPGFLIAFALVAVFSLKLGWFGATGYVRPSESITGWLRSVSLPILSLSLASVASVSLQIRSAVKDSLGLDYVRTLRSRGLSSRRVLFKHIMRNASGPALAILGLQFIGLLGGAVIIERVFAIPGLGQVAVTSTQQGDIPLVMGLVVVMAVIVVVVNLAVDLTTAWLNPKARTL